MPDTIADLSALTSLDLSHNGLTAVPLQLFALPNLATFNVSHNSLTALPFSAPFSTNDVPSRERQIRGTSSFFSPVVTHASTPLPKLAILDASHNKFTASSIDHAPCSLPKMLVKLDLSANPLGDCQSLIVALSGLEKLKEVRFETADIGDESLPSDLFSFLSISSFPNIRLVDFGQTRVTVDTVKSAFTPLGRELNFDFTTEEPPAGVIRVLVGKKVIKEAWELEAERRARWRAMKPQPFEEDSVMAGLGRSKPNQTAKEAWEIEAEQGLLTEGAKRRARAAAAAAEPATLSSPPKVASAPTPVVRKEVQKEAWEIEAEQGLLTEGGRRRARAAAAAAATEGNNSGPLLNRKASSLSASLTNPQYFSERTRTLTLPPSAPLSKGHARAFSHALSAQSLPGDQGRLDVTLPTATLPIGIISTQPFAQTLKILTLTNRRLDVSISLPLESETDLLPSLEELNLDGCGLRDNVPVSRQDLASSSGATTPPRSTEPLLQILAKLFPNLQTLDLSDNALTSASLTVDALSTLILASNDGGTKKGLKHLRIRGNRLAELDGIKGLADIFRGNEIVPEWKLEELDLRDNEIEKLPVELGLLPLEVFLVDGNA